MKAVVNEKEVRVRFAPSPSGKLHFGNGRMALVNFAFARQSNGKFYLRVDDTDLNRSSDDHIPDIVSNLKCLHVEVDEGPFRQSERVERYRQVADQLLKDGYAYHCYLSEEEIEEKRQALLATGKPPILRKVCGDSNSGVEPTVRFDVGQFSKNPVSFKDKVAGQITIPTSAFSDFVLMRSNGMPSYNFATAVDDADYEITHVIRGNEHIPNTARHLLIWRAMKVKAPKFAHLSLLVHPGGKPLSKRDNDSGINYFLSEGYLPEAIAHYLLWIGSTGVGDQPVTSTDELWKAFSWPKSGSTACFEKAKLDFFNHQYMQLLDAEALIASAKKYVGFKDNVDAKGLSYISLFKENFHSLKEIDGASHLWPEESYAQLLGRAEQFLSSAEAGEILANLKSLVERDSPDSEESWQPLLKELAATVTFPKKRFFKGLRLLWTAQEHGPELFKIANLISAAEMIKRL